jgi:Gas vesicle protein
MRKGPRMAAANVPDTSGQGYDPAINGQRVALVDLLDRVLAGGVVISGDITLSIADVDLVTVSLRALVTSVSALMENREQRR